MLSILAIDQAEKYREKRTPLKVSTRIEYLLNTLKHPQKQSLCEYFKDQDDQDLEEFILDHPVPIPEGDDVSPVIGKHLYTSISKPKSIIEGIERYGTAYPKSPLIMVIDCYGKTIDSLTYGKLYKRTKKIAYNLLNKSHKKEGFPLKVGDRVALVYPNSDACNFITAFYGCHFAGIVPVSCEVPVSKRDVGSQQIGFLLDTCSVSVALTSESCFKKLGLKKVNDSSANSKDFTPSSKNKFSEYFKTWPDLNWLNLQNLSKPPKSWAPPLTSLSDSNNAYIEYVTYNDGSVKGVCITRSSMLAHCKAISQICSYSEGEVLVCILDLKRESGLLHAVIASVFNGLHVIFIPYSVMRVNPSIWISIVTKYKASYAIVKSSDLHWSLISAKNYQTFNLSSLKALIITDAENPWSHSSIDSFLDFFKPKGLKEEAICPCATSSEAQTLAFKVPSTKLKLSYMNNRTILSLFALSHAVIRVNDKSSYSSVVIQNNGSPIPEAVLIVIKIHGIPYLCKSDELGEICIASSTTGDSYFGLDGLSNSNFKVQPLDKNRNPISDKIFVKSRLIGFFGPDGNIFICGSKDSIMHIGSRIHSVDDIVATILVVHPMKFIYRGRLAVFCINVHYDERIVIVAEQRHGCTEDESFQWMSRVLRAVHTIHNTSIYCIALLLPNKLPKSSLHNGIHIGETKRRLLQGTLHPANLLLCPHAAIKNLPKPRVKHPEVSPASQFVGNIVKGERFAVAVGPKNIFKDKESGKPFYISEILKWRARSTPDHVLFTLLTNKGMPTCLTCAQLHKRAEKMAISIKDNLNMSSGQVIALLYPPGLDLITAFYGCLYLGLIPVPIRPISSFNIAATISTLKLVIEISKAKTILTTSYIHKLFKSKEAQSCFQYKFWPLIVETEDLVRKKGSLKNYVPSNGDQTSYLDFSVSTTGTLIGVRMSHVGLINFCRSHQVACELYPSRVISICLDPYTGLGFALWCLSGIYSGHQTYLIPPIEIETDPNVWLRELGQLNIRDTFISYSLIEVCLKHFKRRAPNLESLRKLNLRSCVIVAEERPRHLIITEFSLLLRIPSHIISTSFGCRINFGICLSGASAPNPSTVYVDERSLRHNRVKLVEKGSPCSITLLECGKLLPGVKVAVANPNNHCLCADSHLGEIWVSSPHNTSGFFAVYGHGQNSNGLNSEMFSAKLAVGDTKTTYAKSGYLGFVRRTDKKQTDGEYHDAVFILGSLDEVLCVRGMSFQPIDVENTIQKSHKNIMECAVFSWNNDVLVAVIELNGSEYFALDLVISATNNVLCHHQIIVGVVVIVDPSVIPINSRGEKQRMYLRDSFSNDDLDPIYVAYNL